MLRSGLYEQIISQSLSRELASVPLPDDRADGNLQATPVTAKETEIDYSAA